MSEKYTKSKAHAAVHSATARKCAYCSNNHVTVYCPVFKRKSIEERYNVVRQSRLCFNCLKPRHFPVQCESDKRCLKCQQRQHTMLHRDYSSTSAKATAASAASSVLSSPMVNSVSEPSNAVVVLYVYPPTVIASKTENTSLQTGTPSTVLLTTVIVRLQFSEGREVTV